MTKQARTLNIKTPGAPDISQTDGVDGDVQDHATDDPGQDGDAQDAGDTEQNAPAAATAAPALPPDLQALIAAEVRKGIAQGMAAMRRATAAPALPVGRLPTHEEAVAQVKSKGGRAVLSLDGYVCQDPRDARVERDVNGYAKN